MAYEKPITLTGESHVRVRRGLVASVDLYEIKDSELDLLEKGSPADLQLNFSIFLLSLAFSGICTLVSASFANPKTEQAFMLITICSFFIGVYLLFVWFRNKTSLKQVCERIRNRIPPDVVSTDIVDSTSTTIVSHENPIG